MDVQTRQWKVSHSQEFRDVFQRPSFIKEISVRTTKTHGESDKDGNRKQPEMKTTVRKLG